MRGFIGGLRTLARVGDVRRVGRGDAVAIVPEGFRMSLARGPVVAIAPPCRSLIFAPVGLADPMQPLPKVASTCGKSASGVRGNLLRMS